MEVMALAGGEGDADQILHRALHRLGGDVHLRQGGVEHDPAADVVLPDRQFVLTEALLEILDPISVDAENDAYCLHGLSLRVPLQSGERCVDFGSELLEVLLGGLDDDGDRDTVHLH